MKKIKFYSLLILISIFFGDASNATSINIHFGISNIDIQGISTAEIQGEYLFLRGVTNGGSLLIHSEIFSDESSKLSFYTSKELQSEPILLWKNKGGGEFIGETPLIRTENGYQVVLSYDPQWQGQVDTLAIIFPFTAEEVRLLAKFTAEKAGLADKFWLLFKPKAITPASINIFQGPIIFGILWVRVLGFTMLISGMVLWLMFQRKWKPQIRETFLVVIMVYWLLFDFVFNCNIWSNFRTAQASLARGNYFNVIEILPSLRIASTLVPHMADINVEYIGPSWSTYWYTLYLRYELFPAKLTEKHEEADYYFLFLSPFAFDNEQLIVNQASVCKHCSILFRSPTAALFQKVL